MTAIEFLYGLKIHSLIMEANRFFTIFQINQIYVVLYITLLFMARGLRVIYHFGYLRKNFSKLYEPEQRKEQRRKKYILYFNKNRRKAFDRRKICSSPPIIFINAEKYNWVFKK